MDAMRLPKKTPEEIIVRDAAVEKSTQNAILIPFETLKISLEGLELAQQVAAVGNTNALSDAGVAGLTALAAAKAAYYNIASICPASPMKPLQRTSWPGPRNLSPAVKLWHPASKLK